LGPRTGSRLASSTASDAGSACPSRLAAS
jgi:hypothetical protein